MNIEFRDPAELSLHPVVRHIPQLPDDSGDFERLCDSIIGRGELIEPIKITSRNQIVDGRHRWRAAKRAQLKRVACVQIPDDEVASTVLHTLIRRHLTKGQLAYTAYPVFEAAHEEAKERRIKLLKKGQTLPVSDSVGNGKTEAFAALLGISRDLFDQAAKVHKLFENDPEFKAEMEPKILDSESPVGLGAVIAGYAGGKATRGTKRVDGKPERLFFKGFNSLVSRALNLEDTRDSHRAIRDVVSKINDTEDCDRLITVAQQISDAAKARARELAS